METIFNCESLSKVDETAVVAVVKHWAQMDWQFVVFADMFMHVLLSDRPKKLACCVKYTQRPISMNAINGVTIQDSRGPCRLSAIM